MPSIVYDLRYLQAGAEVLERFLLSGDVYWPIGITAPAAESPYPQLTLGGLRLAAARCLAADPSETEQRQLNSAFRQIEENYHQWRVAWENKAGNEFRSRLTQWRNYLEDYRDDPAAQYDRYPYEVFRRVILELLENQAGNVSDAERQMLAGLDLALRESLQEGEFIWESHLRTAFPSQIYWFLYGRLPEEGK